MLEQFSRTIQIFGQDAIQNLQKKHVIIFGIGGVGGYALEALVRAGIGYIDLVDSDKIALSNLNRQLIATHLTLGQYKVDVAKERALSVNPDCQITTHKVFFGPLTMDSFDFAQYDYVIDAIDTVSSKLCLIEKAQAAGTPVISSMGTGNKICPEQLEIADISQTSVCPLAKVMRKELKKRGILHLKVIYSKEQPKKPLYPDETDGKHIPPASTPFVPPVAGFLIASQVIKDLINGSSA